MDKQLVDDLVKRYRLINTRYKDLAVQEQNLSRRLATIDDDDFQMYAKLTNALPTMQEIR